MRSLEHNYGLREACLTPEKEAQVWLHRQEKMKEPLQKAAAEAELSMAAHARSVSLREQADHATGELRDRLIKESDEAARQAQEHARAQGLQIIEAYKVSATVDSEIQGGYDE